ncbi:uncharacterized protein SAPINGB_P004369 [Magnusiomyces paraingens]|uniref:25S rRNA (uridine-N(3))-methyltransferase BMT5-like domain-containing protein n=1 Tax=Magnusiomyces paraingens TaxID=2606893 RepID=A0A5E8BZ85_9ASCO|nr:uncharacterized protein SAPINGB_P004369 [Saprochaete ingens]VVT55000.1 unnamed protein product [Saprochaete ingens]
MAKRKSGGLAALNATLARERQLQQLKNKQLRSQNKLPNTKGSQHGVNKNKQSGNVVKKKNNNKKNDEMEEEENNEKVEEEEEEEEEEPKEEPTEKSEEHEDNDNDNDDEQLEEKTIEKDLTEPESNSSEKRGPTLSRKAFIPFKPTDRVLLVGEGDFSFARSILESGLAKYVRPTNLDSLTLLEKKYPDCVVENISYLKNFHAALPKEDDKENEENEDNEGNDDEKYDYRKYLVDSSSGAPKQSTTPLEDGDGEWTAAPLYEVDAQALHRHKQVCTSGPYDVILFNFPHTGAGIKDQARNVAAQQRLLSGFFGSCVAAEGAGSGVSKKRKTRPLLQPGTGTVVVSLFEGAPYNLWGIKALAKQYGLSLQRSSGFEWAAFPGYSHRLTLGKGDTTKAAETRAARIYVFERADADAVKKRLKQQETKRAQNRAMAAIASNLKGKKGKRKIVQMMKRQKGGS